MLKIKGLYLPFTGAEQTTGNVFYVDSGATGASDSSSMGDSPERPLATLDYAIGRCTATNGDIIFVMPGHAETTTAIAADVAGITIFGIGYGRARPTFTATAAASDLIDVTAANITIKNVRLVGAASDCTSLISIAADDFLCEGCSLEQAETPLSAVVVTRNYDRFTFRGCIFMGTANGPDYGISFAAGSGDCQDYTLDDCTFNYSLNGLDNAGILSSKIDNGVLIKDCRFIGMDLAAIDFNSSSTGLISNVAVMSNNATVAEMIDAGHLGFVDCRVSYKGVSGALIPATTATP